MKLNSVYVSCVNSCNFGPSCVPYLLIESVRYQGYFQYNRFGELEQWLLVKCAATLLNSSSSLLILAKSRSQSGRRVALNYCKSDWAFDFLQPVSFCIYFLSFMVYLRGCGLCYFRCINEYVYRFQNRLLLFQCRDSYIVKAGGSVVKRQ